MSVARVLSFRVAPEKLEEVLTAYRNSLLPQLEQYQGFSALLLLWDTDTGNTLELTLFENEDARDQSEGEGSVLDQKLDTLESILSESPHIENYELKLIS